MFSKGKYYVKSHIPYVFYPYILFFQYRKHVGKRLNLKCPSTYTEKMQLAKLKRRDHLLTELTNKITVRDWVKEKIGEEYLVPVIGGVYSNPDEIDFESLPKQFVIKTNNGSGSNIIVTDKSKISEKEIKDQLNNFLKDNFAYHMLEMQYKDIEPKIYIEEYLVPEGETDLLDFKFFCFSGKVFCSYTRTNTFEGHSGGKVGFFDRDYKLIPYYRADYDHITTQLQKPKNYEKMVEIAETLSKGFSHVRVDLYNISGRVLFGEMTFTTNSGYCKFIPEEFDRILGEQWNLDSGI